MGTPDQASSPGDAGARDDAYDVVVIGAGIGGLTAGALLARAGKKVLIVEADERPGGFARALPRGPYTFDRADHLIMGCAPESPFGPGIVDAVLRHLDVRDRCEFIRMDDPFFVGRFPGLTLEVPGGREAYLEAHLHHFPAEAAGLERLVDLGAQVLREYRAFPVEPRPIDLLLAPRRFPALFRNRGATMRDLIDRELSDARLKAAYATLWLWIGPPPGRASFVTWAIMMASYVEDGPYYCLGSFQRLADALAAGLVESGGELLLGTRATGVLLQDRSVAGVALENGRQVRAPAVISNIDARETFERLLGPDDVPRRYLRRLRAMEASVTWLAMYAATDLDARALGARHDTTLYTDWDHERAYLRALAGEVPCLSILIPTLKDPSLAPRGEHLVILKALAPARGMSSEEGRGIAERMFGLAEEVLPGLRRHLTFVDEGGGGADPRLHLLGPYSGWAVTPRQSGVRRLPQRTPLTGLLLAGHWTQPGLGVATVVRSGIGAARSVLGVSSSAPVLPLRL